jgi:hypothetical protein
MGPTVVIPHYLAKETIGYTLAPSALLQSQLGMPCASLGLYHNKPSLKLSLQSPWELYTAVHQRT